MCAQVPGGYQDSLSSNTELGRAVQNACQELDNLSALVRSILSHSLQNSSILPSSDSRHSSVRLLPLLKTILRSPRWLVYPCRRKSRLVKRVICFKSLATRVTFSRTHLAKLISKIRTEDRGIMNWSSLYILRPDRYVCATFDEPRTCLQ